MLFHILGASSLLLTVATAWNTDVHNQIGFMAETFLTPPTTSVLQHVLEPQYNGSIGRAADWADAYAHTPEGSFSYQWHWIDSADEPPTSCSLCYERDCPEGGCVVSAIANQTEILRGCIADVKRGILTDGSNITCSYALKWLTHFHGDINQPLHASGTAAGGNLFNVTFNNISTELHAVWDGYIIYSDASPTAEWLACTDPATSSECAVSWARESNQWTCDYVYNQTYNGTDLAISGYAKGAYPIVELQISKAALRLATWLNRLVAGDHTTGQEMILQTDPNWVQKLGDGEQRI
ncbi:hypothetical protein H2199_002381 [Coniosporium tulheliwenetii]|uniref:Uncharacterized protein n=1 Tax=Coniosporium tulheliwenetii TaxID=3383036 RepID=A0ACC2ZF79_9PEZI|nr:hypothetical protein H2199_002381 [Cladosporium sp. JES 115]